MSTIAGPTQGAERHAETVGRWKGRPQLARVLRLFIILAPLIISVIYTWLAGKFVPAERLHLGRWTWIGLIFITANLLLAVLRRLTARLLPLVALMKLTLVFPDQAPSRMKATLRKSNSRKLLRNITEARDRGEESDEINNGDYLLQLLMEVNDHDRLTRGHSERVRVYSEMLGEEIGLSADDMNKLRWSALLHDVGKLTVPSEILNKPGRPTEDEWKILSGHPAAGVPLLEPLRPWLGDWIHSADQHHCRWDGTGYPEKLAGTDISLAGRLVAIADAYDVMTSARSYKKPLSVELARQELTDCAGSQFDPNLVRSFLRISLGRLRTVGGPLAWIANLTGSAQLPVPIAGTVTTTAWSAGVASAGIVAATTAGIIAPTVDTPELLAFREPVVAAYDQSASVVEDESITIWLGTSSTNGAPIVTVAAPLAGSVTSSNTPVRSGQLLDLTSAVGDIWQTAATYTPDPGFIGEDTFEFGACLDNGLCSVGTVTIDVLSSNQAPISAEDRVEVLAGRPVGVDVLVNDIDPDSDPLTIVSVGTPSNGVVRIVEDRVEYIPDNGFEGVDTFEYTVTDIEGATSTTTVTITVRPLVVAPSNPVPVSDAGAGYEALEDTAFTTPDVTANDELGGFALNNGLGDQTGLTVDVVATPVAGTLVNNGDGTFTYVPDLNANGTDSFSYVLVTPDGLISEPALVTLVVTPVDDAPVAASDGGAGFVTDEDTPFTSGDVTLNDTDPDGPLSPLGFTIAQQAPNGLVEDNANGTFTYTPDPDFSGIDTFVYSFFDVAGLSSNAATVTVTVTAVNDAPVAVADGGDGFTTSEDTPFQLASLTANDSDLEDGDLNDASITIVDDVSIGALGTNEEGALLYSPNADVTGTDTFSYTVTDSEGLASEPVTVTITITSANDAPVATDDGGDGYETDEDVPFTTTSLLENDSDQEGDDLDPTTIEIVDDATTGVVTVNDDGTVDYAPAADFNGTDTFTYTVADGSGARSEAATVTIVVAAVNDAPVATDDSGPEYSTPEDSPFALPNLAANDNDIEDGSISPDTITLETLPTSGTLSLDPNGDLVYSPNLNFNGIDSFTYTITDVDDLVSEPARVTIEVRSGNDPPVAVGDQGVGFTTAEDTPFATTQVTTNDSDVEDGPADPTTVTVIDGVQNGTLVNNGDGTFTYTPDPDFNGIDTFTYAFNDSGLLLSNVAKVILSVTPINDAPVASVDSGIGYTTDEDTAFTTADVTVNDADIEDGSIDSTTATIVDSAANGTVVNNGDGTFSYSPDPDYNGDDTFTYTVTDSEGIVSAPGLVTITVTSINDTPIAANDGGVGFTTPEDVPLTTTVLTANDVDIEDMPLDPAGLTILDTPANGAVTNNGDGTVTYVPDANYNGDDTFTYTVTDADGAVSNVATVTVSMTSGNDAPVALDDGGADFATLEDTLLTTPNVATNDSDIEDGPADPTTVTVVDSVLNGTLTNNGDGTFDYLPGPDFNGTDSFTYHFNDSGLLLSNVATVTITIQSVNDAPIAGDDAGPGFETLEDVEFTTASVLTNDGDVEDGAPVADTVSIVSDAAGTLTNNGDGTFDYLPGPDFNGTDTFTYTITDNDGLVSAPATVTITIDPVNDAPVANDDAGVGYTSLEDTDFMIGDLLANDSDTEDLTLRASSIIIVTEPVHGVLARTGDGNFEYEPDLDFNGTDSFTYTITDSDGLVSQPATVTIVLDPVNDAPVAGDDEGVGYTTLEDTSFTTPVVTSNDTDIEDGVGNPASTEIAVVATNGSLINNDDGTFTYTPDTDFNGVDTFGYTISDADDALSNVATVTIFVEPVNDAPIANDDSGAGYTTQEDTAVTLASVLLNDGDTEDPVIDPASIAVVSDVTDGSLTTNAGGTFGYEPNPDFNGTDSFTYTITDSDGLTSAPATVTITITAVNDAPVAGDDEGVGYTTAEDTLMTTPNVTTNDGDTEDGGAASDTVSIVLDAAGSLTNNGDGTFDYLPGPDFNGTDSFTYTITDSGGLTSAPATVTIIITAVNDAPVAGDDGGPGYEIEEDTTFITPDVSQNDGDTEDGFIDGNTAALVDLPTNGVIQREGGGRFKYAPNQDFVGVDTFTYTITDADGAVSDPATVTIVITPVNDAPVAADDAGVGFTTNEDDDFTTASVIANDDDVEDGSIDATTVTLVNDVTNGVLTPNGDGTFDYSPIPDFFGDDTFTYTITDDDGIVSLPGTVTITVVPVNDAPVAADDSGIGFTTPEDVSLVTNSVLTNDDDREDGSGVASFVISDASLLDGTLTNNGDGTFLYTPSLNFNGTDTFTYTYTDSGGAVSNTATVTITVTAGNDSPVAGDDGGVGFSTNEDVPFTTPAVTANDSDPEDGPADPAVVTVNVVNPPAGDLVNNGDGTFDYTPLPNFNGTDTFTYVFSDSGLLLSNLATVTIIVGPINDAPDAVDDAGPAWVTDEDVAFTTPNVLDNDSDVEDGAIDPATISIVAGASNGTVTHNGDGTFNYTPNAEYFGNDAFVYAITDSDGEPAQARVELVITTVNDPPVANDDSYATKEDTPITFTPVIDNDADLEDGPASSASFLIETQPSNGDLTDIGAGTLSYQPDQDFFGTDTFTYSYTDSGGLASNIATVTITVEAENDAPVAADDTFTVDEDDLITTSDVTVNDVDAEDGAIDPTTATIVSNVSDGALTDNGDGTFTYEPAADFDGTDSFTYTVTDSVGATSAPATVTFTVTPVNDAPVVTNPGAQSALITAAFELAIAASDADDDTLTYSATSLPAGLAIDTSTGKITGIPASGTAGTYSVRIDVEDDGVPVLSSFAEFDIVVDSWRASTLRGNVAITELLYLGTQDPTQEFVELYNAGSTDVNVTGWVITDSNHRDNGPGDVRYVIPANDASGDPSILAPGEHLVFWMAWDGEMTDPDTGLEYVLNNFTRKLNNTGDDIWVIDGQGGLVDYVAFGSGSGIGTPPPADLNMWDDTHQASLTAPAGTSLSLTPHGIDGDTSACWERTKSGDAAGRCPGALATTDADGRSSFTWSVGVNNNLFIADAGAGYSIAEGDSLTLDGSGTDNSPTTWEWDLDGDGDYDDAVGSNPVIPWEKLVELGLDDDGSYPIALQVDGGIGKDDAVLTISNMAPKVSATGNSQAQAGLPYTLNLDAEDQGDDEITGWIISWGDGTIETITGNPSAVTHIYANVGFTYDILLTAIDEDGTYMQNELLVPSFDNDKIFRYEANTGTFLQSFATGDDPVLAKIGPDGLLYVSNDQTSDIWRFNAETGAFIDIFVADGDSSLDGAEGFAFGPDGDLYVADYNGDRVMQYEKDTGTFVKVFASSGLDGPYGVVFGPSGDLYVGNYKSNHVERFDGTNGSTNVTFVSDDDGGLNDPEQMAFGPDGNLYIAGYGSRDVLRFDGTTGDFIDVFVDGDTGGIPSKPTGLAFGPDGNLYVADHDDQSVRRFDGVTGNYIDDYVPAGAASGGLTKPSLISFLPSLQVRVAT